MTARNGLFGLIAHALETAPNDDARLSIYDCATAAAGKGHIDLRLARACERVSEALREARAGQRALEARQLEFRALMEGASK